MADTDFNGALITEEFIKQRIDQQWKYWTRNYVFRPKEAEAAVKDFFIKGYYAAVSDLFEISVKANEAEELINNFNNKS